MAGRVGFRVRTGWRRPEPSLLEAFGAASSAQVADCMSRLGAMDTGLRPVWPSPRVIGPAVTSWCHSADNLMLHKALDVARAGDVLVVNTQGNTGNAVFGELMATSAVKIGIRAVIVDGVVRDADALATLKLPVYARGLSPNACNKDGAGEVGSVIACGGVAVRSGDVIIADRDGITVVPLEDAAEVARAAIAHMEKERQRLAEIDRGVVVKPEIDETLRRLKVIE